MSLRLARPVPGPVTSPYGWRVLYGRRVKHNGVDFGWLRVDPVRSRRVVAPVDGMVVASAFSSVAGNFVTIRPRDVRYRVRMIHLASRAVSVGDRVRVGQLIGIMGATGSSTRPDQTNLHLDVYLLGVRVNPATYLLDPYPGEAALTGDGATLVINLEEDDMRLIKRENTATPEWSLFHPTLRGKSALERGYMVITDPDEATQWARILYTGAGSEQKEPRDVYVKLQEVARRAHEAYRRGNPVADLVAAPPVEPVDFAALAAQIAALIPAAAQPDLDVLADLVADELGERLRN